MPRANQLLAVALERADADDALLVRVAAGLRAVDLAKERGVSRMRGSAIIGQARRRVEARRRAGIIA